MPGFGDNQDAGGSGRTTAFVVAGRSQLACASATPGRLGAGMVGRLLSADSDRLACVDVTIAEFSGKTWRTSGYVNASPCR
jgi:hypothetical protein